MVKVILDRQRNQYRKGDIIDVAKHIADKLVSTRRAHYFTGENKAATSKIIKSEIIKSKINNLHNIPKASHGHKIGFCTYQDAWGRGEVASTRIRVQYVKKYIRNAIISNNPDELLNCEIVIFQTRYTKSDIELARKLKVMDKIIILDLTDPHWNKYYNLGREIDANLNIMIKLADLVTFPTEPLMREFESIYYGYVAAVIPDRIDLTIHDKVKKHISKEDYIIFWHGSYGNRDSIELARNDLEKLGKEFKLKLLCIYDRHKEFSINPFKNLELECREWSNQDVIDGILESDMGINPKYTNWKSYKSNNKTIKSWALGVPCVEYDFYNELKCFLSSADLRNKEGSRLRKVVKEKYNSRQSADEIENIADILCRQKRYKLLEPEPEPVNDIVVYTAITGKYDKLNENQCTEGADFIAFMDKPVESKTWRVIPFKRKFTKPIRDAKIFKVLSHQFTRKYKYSLWIDGNFILKVPVKKLIKECLKNNDIAIFKHNKRNCIYLEGKYDVLIRKDNEELIEKQLARYRIDGHPPNCGLFACGVLLRRNCKAIEKLNNAWWSEITIGSDRDQTSFAYLIRKLKIKFGYLNSGEYEYYNSSEFEYIDHKEPYDRSFI